MAQSAVRNTILAVFRQLIIQVWRWLASVQVSLPQTWQQVGVLNSPLKKDAFLQSSVCLEEWPLGGTTGQMGSGRPWLSPETQARLNTKGKIILMLPSITSENYWIIDKSNDCNRGSAHAFTRHQILQYKIYFMEALALDMEKIICLTRELPGVALVNILNGWIFTVKGNTHLKWNIEVLMLKRKNIWMRHNFLWNSILASAKDFSYSFHLEWMSLTFGVITQRQRHKSKS